MQRMCNEDFEKRIVSDTFVLMKEEVNGRWGIIV